MIEHSVALPLYHQVAGVLRQRIEDGAYSVGDRLSSEDELATEFDVSRATVRQAVGELVDEGLVVRRQGRGTFVHAPRDTVLKQRFRGSLADLIRESHRAASRDLNVSRGALFPGRIAKALHLDSPHGTLVQRTRTMDGQPFGYTMSYMSDAIGKRVTEAALRRTALMELLIAQGVKLSSASQSIRPQLADLELCSHLEVELGAALLYVERVVYDGEGRPMEFVRSWYRGDRYEYTVDLELDVQAGDSPYEFLA